ncbi:unnamed protein product, partial [Notodromas monacha]
MALAAHLEARELQHALMYSSLPMYSAHRTSVCVVVCVTRGFNEDASHGSSSSTPAYISAAWKRKRAFTEAVFRAYRHLKFGVLVVVGTTSYTKTQEKKIVGELYDEYMQEDEDPLVAQITSQVRHILSGLLLTGLGAGFPSVLHDAHGPGQEVSHQIFPSTGTTIQ